MTKKKEDYEINVDGDKVTIFVKEKFFWFIDIWSELTELDTEHGDETVIQFNSVDDAKIFIENIAR